MKETKETKLKKTTLTIPMDLWLRAQQRILDEARAGTDTDLRALLLEGLELRLKQKKGAKT